MTHCTISRLILEPEGSHLMAENIKINRVKTAHGWVLECLKGNRVIFSTLDDCFGMDRVRDWATSNNHTIGGAK